MQSYFMAINSKIYVFKILKKKCAIFLLLIGFHPLHAQNITMHFPHFAGKTYDFIIFQGTQPISVTKNTIPEDGKFTLQIPEEYAPYSGMSRWLLTNSETGGGLDMIIPGQDFSVSCNSAQPSEQNIIYTHNEEVRQLNALNHDQEIIIRKFEAMIMATTAYKNDKEKYDYFKNEIIQQKATFKDFSNSLKINSNYAKKVLPIINITKGVGSHLEESEEKRAANISKYIAEDLNWEALYTSGHWETVLDSWVQIQTKIIKNDEVLLSDFTKMERRITQPSIKSDFIKTITKIFTQYGKDREIQIISPVVLQSTITDYSGILSVYKNALIGNPAPDLSISESSVSTHKKTNRVIKSSDFSEGIYEQTLLVFYQTGCGACDFLMKKLQENYPLLKKKKVRILALSADESESLFRKNASEYPWKDSYSDFEGKNGINFKNYGVKGTPTLFIIDNKGIILSRMSTWEEVYLKLKPLHAS